MLNRKQKKFCFFSVSGKYASADIQENLLGIEMQVNSFLVVSI